MHVISVASDHGFSPTICYPDWKSMQTWVLEFSSLPLKSISSSLGSFLELLLQRVDWVMLMLFIWGGDQYSYELFCSLLSPYFCMETIWLHHAISLANSFSPEHSYRMGRIEVFAVLTVSLLPIYCSDIAGHNNSNTLVCYLLRKKSAEPLFSIIKTMSNQTKLP